MHLFFRCAHIDWLYVLVPLVIGIAIIRFSYMRMTLYQFPLTSYLASKITYRVTPMYILHFLRMATLTCLLILISQPQLVDQRSNVTVEGVDIMMVLDISGSMACFDDMQDRRTRLQIAKQEGMRFVEKRHNDSIGLVVFGSYPVMRCPLTPDKKMLVNLIDSLQMNERDSIHEGTVISQAVMTAAQHLHGSKSATKIIILLTDGEPSENDFSPDQAIEIAQAFGIKVYTIGIGNNGLSMQTHPLFGVVQYQNHFDTKLLESLADKTGGTFFDVKKSQDLVKIYDMIDRLEKTTYQDTVINSYQDYFMPFAWLALFLLLIELFFSSFLWTIL